MVYNWILCFSLLCATSDQHKAMQSVEVKTVLSDCRNCLMKKGRDWDDRSWSYTFEWDVCLENQLFKKITVDQKLKIKRYMSGLGYYWFNAKNQTYSGAKNRIKPKDIDGILAVIEKTLQPQERGVGLAAPVAGPSVPGAEEKKVSRDLPGNRVAPAPMPSPSVQAAEGKKISKDLPESRVVAAPVPGPSVQAAEGKKISKDLPENRVVATPVPPPTAPAVEGKKINMDLSEDRVVVASGVVLLPKGVFLLVRKGNDYGAIRFADIRQTENARAGSGTYESYFQGDGSGAFLAITVKKRGGRLAIGRKSSKLRMGEWSFKYTDPGSVEMFPYAAPAGDYGYEFAPIGGRDITTVDVHDKRIQWYKFDQDRGIEIFLKDLPR